MAVILLTECTPVYVPSSRNIPDLREKGETKLSVILSSNGLGLSANILPADRIGLMINGSFANQQSDEMKTHKHSFGEIGVGYHIFSENFNFALYAGHGIGKSSATDRDILNERIFAEGDFQRTFLQPSFSYHTETFIPSLIIRFTKVGFSNYSDNVSADPRKLTATFVEPALNFGFIIKPITLDFQMGFISPVNKEIVEFDYRPFHMGLGIAYRFNYL